jgi:hypothetical protein
MTVIEKLKPLLWGALTLAGVYLVMDYAHYVGIAHAANADPGAAVQAGSGAAIDVWTKDGPLWGGLLVLMYALRSWLDKQHVLMQGRLLSLLTGVAMVGVAALNWHFGSAPVEGILTAAFAAFALFEHSTVQPKAEPAAPPAPGNGTAAATVLAIVLLGAAGGATQISCAGSSQSSRQATVTSLYTGLNAASAALQVYSHDHEEAIVAKVRAGTMPASDGITAVATLRTKLHPVETARDAAYDAIRVALTINDDPSLAGAQRAIDLAITSITALTGGTP